jgi:hypothetical protein
MATSGTSSELAMRLIVLGRKDFNWTAGAQIPLHRLVTPFYESGLTLLDLQAALDFGVLTRWFYVESTAGPTPLSALRLTALGAKQKQ